MNPLEIISSFLEVAREKSIQEFYTFAFLEAKKYLDFDSGYFFAFSKVDGVEPGEFHHFNLDGININDYLPFLESDPSIKKALPYLGKPLIDSEIVSNAELEQTTVYQEFYKPHKIEDVLFTIRFDDRINLYKDLSFVRDSRKRPFSQDETKIKEILDFAFFEGRKIALTKMINNDVQFCVCNRDGVILSASNGFSVIYKNRKISGDLLNRLELSKIFGLRSSVAFQDLYYFDLKNINNDYVLVTVANSPQTILTLRQLEIAFLYSVEKMTRDDLSDFLEISIGTVKNHLNDIKERYGLKRTIGKRGNIDIRRRVGERLKDEWNKSKIKQIE